MCNQKGELCFKKCLIIISKRQNNANQVSSLFDQSHAVHIVGVDHHQDLPLVIMVSCQHWFLLHTVSTHSYNKSYRISSSVNTYGVACISIHNDHDIKHYNMYDLQFYKTVDVCRNSGKISILCSVGNIAVNICIRIHVNKSICTKHTEKIIYIIYDNPYLLMQRCRVESLLIAFAMNFCIHLEIVFPKVYQN